jgi:hypothetical protein
MNYAVEMGSCAMVYIPSFIKIGSGIQKLMEGGGGWIRRETDTQQKPTFISFFRRSEEISKYQQLK